MTKIIKAWLRQLLGLDDDAEQVRQLQSQVMFLQLRLSDLDGYQKKLYKRFLSFDQRMVEMLVALGKQPKLEGDGYREEARL